MSQHNIIPPKIEAAPLKRPPRGFLARFFAWIGKGARKASDSGGFCSS